MQPFVPEIPQTTNLPQYPELEKANFLPTGGLVKGREQSAKAPKITWD